jgi:hypothetical protein
MKIEKNSPALPCMPMQDSLGRFFSPISGFTKYEFALLEIYKGIIASDKFKDDYFESYLHAREATDNLFYLINEEKNEKEDNTTIIQ